MHDQARHSNHNHHEGHVAFVPSPYCFSDPFVVEDNFHMADGDTADCEIGRVHVADSHNHLAGQCDLWAPSEQQDQEGENSVVDYNHRKQAKALPTDP